MMSTTPPKSPCSEGDSGLTLIDTKNVEKYAKKEQKSLKTHKKKENKVKKSEKESSAIGSYHPPQTRSEIEYAIKQEKKAKAEQRKWFFEMEDKIRMKSPDNKILIETEEELEWFIEKYMAPIQTQMENSPNYQRIQYLARKGVIPQNPLDRSNYMNKLKDEVLEENPELSINNEEDITLHKYNQTSKLLHEKLIEKANLSPEDMSELPEWVPIDKIPKIPHIDFSQEGEQGEEGEEDPEDRDMVAFSLGQGGKVLEKNFKQTEEEAQQKEETQQEEVTEEVLEKEEKEESEDFKEEVSQKDQEQKQLIEQYLSEDIQVFKNKISVEKLQKKDELVTEEAIYSFSQSGDKTLDMHVFANLPVLRPINFNKRKYYKQIRIKYAKTKPELLQQTCAKLQLLLNTYTKEDFEKVKFYKLNCDQILVFLSNKNFIQTARLEKVVESLHHLQKSKELSYYNRPEIKNVVKTLCTNPAFLNQMEPSYVASLAYTLAKMKIEDEEIWFALANYDQPMDLRSTATYLIALQQASARAPIIMDFSDKFTSLELPIIQMLESQEKQDPKSLTQIISTYSKSQVGSVEFYSALEKHILECASSQEGGKGSLSALELSNIMYSYALTPQCSDEMVKDLLPIFKRRLEKLKAKEIPALAISMRALDMTGNFKGDIVRVFDQKFVENYERMTARDVSDFWFYFTKVLHQPESEDKVVGSDKFYNRIQKTMTRLISRFEGPDMSKIFYKYNSDLNKYYTGRSRNSIRQKIKRHAIWLISNNKIKPYDAYEIMKHTQPTDPEQMKKPAILTSDGRLDRIKEVVKDIKEGKKGSKDWFKTVEEVRKASQYISDQDMHKIATMYVQNKKYFK